MTPVRPQSLFSPGIPEGPCAPGLPSGPTIPGSPVLPGSPAGPGSPIDPFSHEFLVFQDIFWVQLVLGVLLLQEFLLLRVTLEPHVAP